MKRRNAEIEEDNQEGIEANHDYYARHFEAKLEDVIKKFDLMTINTHEEEQVVIENTIISSLLITFDFRLSIWMMR